MAFDVKLKNGRRFQYAVNDNSVVSVYTAFTPPSKESQVAQQTASTKANTSTCLAELR